ncbi:hypothetical protein ElyMa_005761400 [Elysia marginata]|uniref:Uncharacterized protein n=1 Tax=Elysia marginata TaxID=1093978 RepID=A0AAV4FR52_9GAST|nr:hypothetical protein ElyMa_005761400 [Elysia marginata]
MDYSEIKDTLVNTDVLLSLNKRERWSLPATVSHMIREGCFSKTNRMVSLLERHKLKRRSNCVGFACSKEPGRTGPGFHSQNTNTLKESQKKYISYNLNCVDQFESRRKIKKSFAEQKKAVLRERRRDNRSVRVRTFNVFTVEGRKGRNVTNGSSVYRLEVFYPCPQSCSLTYNPKYTDVIMTENDDGEMEIRSNTKNEKKSKKKHRKRLATSNLAALNKEMTI